MSINKRITDLEERLRAESPSDWERFRRPCCELVLTDKGRASTSLKQWAALIEGGYVPGTVELIDLLKRNAYRLLGEAADELGNPELAAWVRGVGGVRAGEPMEAMPQQPKCLTRAF